jgi:hypothetical protein
MSTSFTPSNDLMLKAKIPQVPALFTTFAAGHFVKPGTFTQPVKPAIAAEIKPASFAGCYTEVYAAAPLDVDYEEPNAVTEEELELVATGSDLHQLELPVIDGLATNEIESHRSASPVHQEEIVPQRTAA